MSRRRMHMATAVAAAAALAFTAACSGGGETGGGDNGGNGGGAAEEAQLRLALWDEAQMPATQAIIDEFEDANAGVTVEIELTPIDQYWTKLETAATGRAAPDVFWMSMGEFRRFALGGVLVDYSELMERDGYTLDGMYAELQNAYEMDGGLYGIPKDIDNLGLWYNKDHFDAAGVDYPDETWTWDDLVEAAVALTDAENNVYGFAASPNENRTLMSIVHQNGGTLLYNDGTPGFEEPAALEAMNWWHDLYAEHGVSPTAEQFAETSGSAMFSSGQVAMWIGGSWMAGQFAADPAGESFDVAPLPVGPVGAGSAGHGIGYAMYAESEYPEQAWELVKFLGSERASEIQAETSTVIPAHEAAASGWVESAPQFNLQAFIDQASSAAFFIPSSINSGQVRAEINAVMQRVFMGELTVEEGAAELTAFAESLRD